MFQSIINKIFLLLHKRLDELNRISLTKSSSIDRNSKIKGSQINGNITIKSNCKIIKVRLEGKNGISVGRFTSINGPNTVIISKINKIEIGAFCSIARNVMIQENNHNFRKISTFFFNKNVFKGQVNKDFDSKGPIIIGNDVWIGANSSILSGITIGDGAVIAANTVVTKNVPPYAICAGNPMRILKYRFDDKTIEEIQNLKWWDWSIQRIKDNESLFNKEYI